MLLEHLITLNTDQNVVGFLFYFFWGGGAGGSLLIENRAFFLWLSLSRSVRGSLYKSFFCCFFKLQIWASRQEHRLSFWNHPRCLHLMRFRLRDKRCNSSESCDALFCVLAVTWAYRTHSSVIWGKLNLPNCVGLLEATLDSICRRSRVSRHIFEAFLTAKTVITDACAC